MKSDRVWKSPCGLSRRRKVMVLMTLDFLIILGSNVLGTLFLSPFLDLTWHFFLSLVISELVYFGLAHYFHIYMRVNRYLSLKEIRDILLIMFAVLIVQMMVFFIFDYPFSDRLAVFTFLLSALGIIATRLLWFSYHERKVFLQKAHVEKKKNVLIIGAGGGARLLLNSLHTSKKENDMNVVGLLDDDPNMQNLYIESFRVLGKIDDAATICRQYEVHHVVLAIPSLAPRQVEAILAKIQLLNINVSTLPPMEELAKGSLKIAKFPEIDIIDLLGREEVKLDLRKIKELITGKVILVTGAGGSIGSEICRQVLPFKPKKLLLLGHGENSIYLIERELKGLIGKESQVEIVPIIADVQDRDEMFKILGKFRPDIVYHAAAHKHVPLMEANPEEAVKNNIYGTLNVAEAAKKYDVPNFVMVSTDKAVRPPNVMGSTKRIAEMIVTGLNEEGKTKFSAVRFGNVLGSRGSVIPVFKEQIKNGGPITVTDFRMTRYFMTIPEASRLVIQSGALSRGGEIFILDMGQPVKILDLAKKMIQLSGYTEEQIPIVESGIRAGEKLYEELLVDKEKNNKQVFEKIFIGNVRGFTLNEIFDFLDQLSYENPALLAKQVREFANRSSE